MRGVAFALRAAPEFPPMKRKRTPKSVVPEGRIWWKSLKRHPLNALVGQVIHRLRLRRRWSLDDLAKACLLTKSYLCGLERGAHSPTLEVMLRVEAAFRMVAGGVQRLAHRWLRVLSPARG